MKSIYLMLLALSAAVAAQGQTFKPTDWDVALLTEGITSNAMVLGSSSAGSDNWTGEGYCGLDLGLFRGAALCLKYHEQGVDGWVGGTGYYDYDYRAPYSHGQMKAYGNIYLWCRDVTLPTPYRIGFRTAPVGEGKEPVGYTGHLVLDYVPAECQYTGPMDFWLDLSVTNHLTLPTIVTDDPLSSTRMHMDIYAVPEPSSLAALICGLAGVGGVVMKRRRR